MAPVWLRAILTMIAAGLLIAATGVPDTREYDRLAAQAQTVMLTDPAAARAAARAAQAAAEAHPPGPTRATKIAATEWLQSEAALRMNDIAGARLLIDNGLSLFGSRPKATKLLGDIRLTRAGISAAEGKVTAALVDYQLAHNTFRTIGDSRSQAKALISIGMLYKEGDDNESSLKYLDRALETFPNDAQFSMSVLNAQAIVLKDLGRFSDAKRKLDAALRMARERRSQYIEVLFLGNYARLHIRMGDLRTARATIERAFAMTRTEESTAWRPEVLSIAAEIALKSGQLQRARGLIEEALVGQPLDKTDVGFREAHYTAYAIYTALNDKPRALVHLQAMKRLDDQIWKLTASTNTALMAARFDSANQEARIARLKAADAARQLAMAEAQTRFERILSGSIGTAAMIVLGLLGFGLWQSRKARLRLTVSNIALEKALAAKTEFLATTSHEIRTPLNGILGMTQVMLADPRLDAASRDRIGIVHGAGLTMRGLVDDILDVAKMEAGNLDVEARPFDLKAMLEDVTRIWREQAHAKGLGFNLELADCPRGIVGDAGRVRQVVYNLLSNAVKFTAAGSVTVRAVCAHGQLTIAVSDTGIGIPAHKHGEIFESFKQADGGTTRQFGGTGLGLAIVKNIAAAMQGNVTVDSVFGEGTTFTVTLPYEPVDLAEPVAAVACGGLLIVDRNPIARAMLKAVLAPRAGEICFAGSPAEAVARLGQSDIARVLIDEATMRGDEGDPIAAVATIAAASAVPVAVLWSNLDDATHDALIAAGADQVIAKPIAGPALASALYTCNTGKAIVTQAA